MTEPRVSAEVADALGVPVGGVSELDGGEVGQVHRVTFADGETVGGHQTVVAKTGKTPLGVEAFMLSVLSDRDLPVPEVVHAGDDLLVLEYVEGDGEFGPAAERDAARHLAALHDERPDESGEQYGFPRDTLTGPYRQPNPWTESWVAFFRDRRLRHFAGKASEAGVLQSDLRERLDALAADFDSWLPDSPPSSLVHGDVWENNLVVRGGAVRAFLDPACYFGHAEVELAYADFSGLGDAFFETYDDERGIDAGFFEGRREVYQTVPVLEHLLYFEDDRYARELTGLLDGLGY